MSGKDGVGEGNAIPVIDIPRVFFAVHNLASPSPSQPFRR